ncbi:MAG: PepSY-like domain-containing protein [Mediterranea sp.]|nr:PepSY-like domain-containing protein [Mediterranea sp.]
MKKSNILSAFCMGVLLMVSTSVSAQYDKPITKEQLPKRAQEFLNAHFADKQITHVIQDDDLVLPDYDVYFAEGIEVSFHNNGDWDSVDGNRQAIPTKFILPAIVTYVQTTYPGMYITEIDKDRRKFDVHLSNGLELVFNKKGAILGIDYDD